MRYKVGFAVVALVMVIGLGWAMAGMDVQKTANALASYELVWLVPMLSLHFCTFLLRTQRFRLLLDHPVRYRAMASVIAVGFLAINAVPFRMGEFVRPYLLAEKYGVPWGSGLAAVVLERLLDIIALLTLLLICGLFIDVPGTIRVGDVDLLATGQRALGTAALVGLIGVLVLGIGGHPVVSFGERVLDRTIPALKGPFVRLASRFVDGFRALAARPERAVGAILCTAGVWTGATVSVAIGMWGLEGLTARWDIVIVNWAATMTAMSVVPTPGFIGSFEAGSVGSLTLFHVPKDVAGAFAIVMHLSMLGFTVVTGSIALLVEGWSLTRVVQESRSQRHLQTPVPASEQTAWEPPRE